MKNAGIVGLLLGMALTVSAPAQVSVYVGITPPPLPYEPPPPPPPVVGMVWVGGFWAPQGHHYRWVAGRYERPPYAGASWSHPHYDHYREGWKYDEGHWGHEDHDHGYDHDHGHGHGHD
jgi:hypothetical protein